MNISDTALFTITNVTFLPVLRVFLRSLQIFHGDSLPVHLYAPDLSPEQLRTLQFYKNLHLASVAPDIVDGPKMLGADEAIESRVYYARFAAWHPQFLPQYKRILFIDADILVYGRLDELLAETRFIAVVESYEGPDKVFIDHADSRVQALLLEDSIRIEGTPANCGVLLIPASFRTIEHYNELTQLTLRYREYLAWADQSVLNLWMTKHHILITAEPKFNFQFRRLLQTYDGLDSARLLHFNGLPFDKRLFLMKTGLFCLRFPILRPRTGAVLRWAFHHYERLWKYIYWRHTLARLFGVKPPN